MKASLLLLLLCAGLTAQPAAIEGTVVNVADGAPLGGTHISLIAMDAGSVKSAYGAMSDRAGHFSIIGIAADTYILLVERTGFLQARKTGDSPIPTIHLKAGQQIADFQISMAARSVIAGRVLDEAGDPMPGVTVQGSTSPDGPQLLLLHGSPYVSTDDRGEFRIVTPPGKYYLKATPPHGSADAPEIRSDGTSEITYGPTNYPNPIEAAAGRDATGIEIRMVRQQILGVGGVVTGPEGPASANVWLRSKDGSRRSVLTGANGHFAFSKLPAGPYRLFAQAPSKPQWQSQVIAIDLNGHDESNVQLLMQTAGDLSGTLEMPGVPAEQKHSVRLENIGFVVGDLGRVSGGTVDGQGAFHIANVPPGRYKVRIEPALPDGYVKSVVLDGSTMPTDVVDFSRGVRSAQMKVTAGSNGARLSGSILDKKGDPPNVLKAIVLLVGNPVELMDAEQAQVTDAGHYSFERVPPGKYRLLAVDVLTIGGALESDAMKALAAKAEAFEIKEGDRLTKSVTVMSREDADGSK